MLVMLMVDFVMVICVLHDSSIGTALNTGNTSSDVFYRHYDQTKSTAVPAHTSPTEMSGMSDSDPLGSPYPCRQCAWRSASSSEEEADWIPRSNCSVSSSYRYALILRCYISEQF